MRLNDNITASSRAILHKLTRHVIQLSARYETQTFVTVITRARKESPYWDKESSLRRPHF